MSKVYKCGDGRVFLDLKDAKVYCEGVFARSGVILGIEEEEDDDREKYGRDFKLKEGKDCTFTVPVPCVVTMYHGEVGSVSCPGTAQADDALKAFLDFKHKLEEHLGGGENALFEIGAAWARYLACSGSSTR